MPMNVNLPRRAFVRRVSRHLNKNLTLNCVLLYTYLNFTISAIKTKTTANPLILTALRPVYAPVCVIYLTYISIYTYYYNNVLICVVFTIYYIIFCAQGRARLWRAPGELDIPDPLSFLSEN